VTERCVLAIDAGTTGVRCRAVYTDDRRVVAAHREFTQHFPEPGLVEHDADEIWHTVQETTALVLDRVGLDAVAAIGITNQRDTTVAWDRETGVPFGRAIVWQDRRTAERC
jgi:glycerol kinase